MHTKCEINVNKKLTKCKQTADKNVNKQLTKKCKQIAIKKCKQTADFTDKINYFETVCFGLQPP